MAQMRHKGKKKKNSTAFSTNAGPEGKKAHLHKQGGGGKRKKKTRG